MKNHRKNKKIMVFGTFDIIHGGHENFFAQARALGPGHENSQLVVSVARDKNVKKIKGFKPRHAEKSRMDRLRNHHLVDKAVLGGADDHIPHIVKEAPDIIALGYDQKAYVKELKQKLAAAGLRPKIVRLKPFRSKEYKTATIAPAGKPIKIAIFDIDGTIFRSSLVLELMSVLVAKKIFKKSTLGEISASYEAWLNRQGSYEDFIMKLVTVYYSNVVGCQVKKVREAIELLLLEQRDRLYRYTRTLIREAKRDGYFLFAVSGSPTDIVKPFADYLGFHGSCGREYEIKNGRYTGRVLNDKEMNLNKDQLVKQYLAEHGLTANFKKSFAIGDTETEIPLLKIVGRPIAFNPNRQLADYAKKHKWQIILERKDVVYNLKNYDFNNLL
jgi:HAD superfamily hydrolase (TIGR01490 family)